MNYDNFKTKRLKNLLKQISIFNSNLKFIDSYNESRIIYTFPKNFSLKFYSHLPLTSMSMTIAKDNGKNSRNRYINLFKILFQINVSYIPKFSSIDEYILKLTIHGGI